MLLSPLLTVIVAIIVVLLSLSIARRGACHPFVMCLWPCSTMQQEMLKRRVPAGRSASASAGDSSVGPPRSLRPMRPVKPMRPMVLSSSGQVFNRTFPPACRSPSPKSERSCRAWPVSLTCQADLWESGIRSSRGSSS